MTPATPSCPLGNGDPDGLGVDLVSAELYGDGDPHAVWRELRRTAPVSWHPVEPHQGFWSVTRHADVSRVLREYETFSSQRGTLLNLLGKGDPASGRQMAVTDPPRHTAMRDAVQRALSIRAIENYRENIRELVAELLAPLGDGGPFDLADAMAGVPMAVTGTIMALPRPDWARLTYLATASLASDDPKYQTPAGPAATLRAAHRDILTYFQDVVTARRDAPGDDLIGTLLTMEMDGRRLTVSEVIANCYSLLIGAIVTTPQVPTCAVLELAGTRVLDDWAAAPELMLSGIEEAVRWASPTNHFMRYVLHDTELAGVPIKSGDAVVVWLGSANRDEAVFDEPFTFDISRKPNKHIAFGVGPHYCVGHTVARVTLRVVFAELLGRFTGFELAGPARRLRSNIIAGVAELPITARRRSVAAQVAR